MKQLDFIDLSAARQILKVSACNDGACLEGVWQVLYLLVFKQV
jgi:hypothetical protein